MEQIFDPSDGVILFRQIGSPVLVVGRVKISSAS
jgi:hypothetical protein